MSGTSVDGVDVALVEIKGEGFDQRIKLLAFHSMPYSKRVREGILAVSNNATHTSEISQMNFFLGAVFGDAVVEACRRSEILAARLELVGSHGQTIYHQGKSSRLHGQSVASTLQIGEPAVIAERTGAPVVADFRTADMAAGGQGAPLVPFVDYLLYRHEKLGRVALNIGGISNVTAIPPKAPSSAVLAFDTGPGNMIIDALVSQFSRGTQKFDRDGRMAASGTVNPALLKQLISAPYFRQPPPKSAGREQYGPPFLSDLLGRGLPPADLVATATAFTAQSIALGVEKFLAPAMEINQLIVSGGGLHNPQVIRGLREHLPDLEILPSNDFGIDSDAKEAIAFAVLAYESYHGRPANLPSATGARHPCVLGKLVFPPPARSS
jgi:anhydro-N-acetylmuramic acid kinase